MIFRGLIKVYEDDQNSNSGLFNSYNQIKQINPHNIISNSFKSKFKKNQKRGGEQSKFRFGIKD